ncbi:MAG: hypothetical protein R3264_05865 [Anaerolineae bacterium]|nr:hypothetical protein [Anaerolineae bacterium]
MSKIRQPIAIQVAENGALTVRPEQVAELGLVQGEHLLLLPLQADQFLLVKMDTSEALPLEALTNKMREAFQQAGYTNREDVINLVRDIKKEMAQEW